MERLGRIKHADLGPCVRISAMIDRREQEYLFPIDQSRHAMHPRHPTGYHADGTCAGSFSPSLSFYNELCRYAGFKWHVAEHDQQAGMSDFPPSNEAEKTDIPLHKRILRAIRRYLFPRCHNATHPPHRPGSREDCPACEEWWITHNSTGF